MIDWERFDTLPPNIGDEVSIGYSGTSITGYIVQMIDFEGDDTEDGEMCVTAVIECEDGLFDVIDFREIVDSADFVQETMH